MIATATGSRRLMQEVKKSASTNMARRSRAVALHLKAQKRLTSLPYVIAQYCALYALHINSRAPSMPAVRHCC